MSDGDDSRSSGGSESAEEDEFEDKGAEFLPTLQNDGEDKLIGRVAARRAQAKNAKFVKAGLEARQMNALIQPDREDVEKLEKVQARLPFEWSGEEVNYFRLATQEKTPADVDVEIVRAVDQVFVPDKRLHESVNVKVKDQTSARLHTLKYGVFQKLRAEEERMNRQGVFSKQKNRQRTRSMFKVTIQNVIHSVHAMWYEVAAEVAREENLEPQLSPRTLLNVEEATKLQKSQDQLRRLRSILKPPTGTYVPGSGFVEKPTLNRQAQTPSPRNKRKTPQRRNTLDFDRKLSPRLEPLALTPGRRRESDNEGLTAKAFEERGADGKTEPPTEPSTENLPVVEGSPQNSGRKPAPNPRLAFTKQASAGALTAARHSSNGAAERGLGARQQLTQRSSQRSTRKDHFGISRKPVLPRNSTLPPGLWSLEPSKS